MNTVMPTFRKPSAGEAVFNRLFGFLVGMGLGFPYNYLLQVRGRKTGRLYSTPIDLLELEGKKYLVAPRGRTQWVRNAEAAGEVVLKRGRYRQSFWLRAIADEHKPRFLKAYLDRFHREVQRYFPVRAGSDEQAFAIIVRDYPVFELSPK
ncbi:MAG TPA: nitroreductase/quinone reductase family protein [Terriglobales bacterium]|nr:nitroreductase/quinone reductase family protein [Terriglobales bacterium]